MSKIFGIGLSKTGTTSLSKALEILGLRSIRLGTEKTLSIPEDFDAATHEVIAANFEKLDHLYPGSLFIYTTRDKNDWLRSVRRHWRLLRKSNFPDMGSLEMLYGLSDFRFDSRIYSASFDRHEKHIETYFDGRDDLLIMDPCAGDGWEKLCPFLGLPIPDVPFPCENRKRGFPFRQAFRRFRKYALKPLYKPLARILFP